MILRVEDNPKIIIRQDYQPLIYTGTTQYIFVPSGNTQLTQSGGNPDTVVIYSPTGGSATWGLISGTLASQTDLQLALDAKLNITDFNIYTGATSTTLSGLRTDLNTVSGQTASKLETSLFNTYTGTTAPATYLGINALNTYWDSGETVSWVNSQGFLTGVTGYVTTTDFDTYTGTTAPATYLPINALDTYWNSGETVSYVTGLGYLTGVTAAQITGVTDTLYLHSDALDTYWDSGETVSWVNSQGFLTSITAAQITGVTDTLYLHSDALDTYWDSGETTTAINNATSGFITGYTFTQSGATVITEVGNNINIYSPIHVADTWAEVTAKPSWLSGTTLSDFQTGHTHSYSNLTDKPDLSVYTLQSTIDTLTGTTLPATYAPINVTDGYWTSAQTTSYVTGLNYVTASIIDNIWTSAQTTSYVTGLGYLTGVTWNDVSSKPAYLGYVSGLTSAAQTQIDAKLDLDATIVSVTGTTTIDATYKGKIIEASGTFTITLPDSMDTGMRVDIVNVGTGTITIAASTTLQSKDSAVTLANQYGGGSVYHRGSDVWLLVGDLT